MEEAKKVEKVEGKTPAKIILVYADGTTEDIQAGAVFSVSHEEDGCISVGSAILSVSKEDFCAVANTALRIAEHMGIPFENM